MSLFERKALTGRALRTLRSESWLAAMAIFLLLTACSTRQIYSVDQTKSNSLGPKDLEAHGLALITSSTVTGQEQDKQALALIFANVLAELRPGIRHVTLSETLGDINRAGYADEYKHMFTDYSDTGIFKRDALRKIGDLTGTRYLAQLKLASFTQGSHDRFGVLGLRLVQTMEAKLRLFLQIWDSQDGSIAWEGTAEESYSYDTIVENPVTFKAIVEDVARKLIGRLP